jgi:hypothetical protein
MRGIAFTQRQAAVAATVAMAAVVLVGALHAFNNDRPLLRVEIPTFSRFALAPAESHEGAKPVPLASLGADEAADAVAQTVGQPGRAPLASTVVDPGLPASKDGVMPVAFDLLQPAASGETVGGDAIVVRKAVRINDREVGSMPIHIDGDSRLLVDSGELRRILAKAGVSSDALASANGAGLRSFTQLRSAGLDLRYDPASDTIRVTAS